MRSVQLVAPRVLEERPFPDLPDPKPGEILVKLKAVGLCGSDLHWYQDGRVGRFATPFPAILGHEPVGVVMQCGPGVTAHKPGDRVVIEPNLSCGHCEFCLAGFHNNCVHAVFMGGPQLPGFFREYAVVPTYNATPIPAEMSDQTATLIEPVAVMAHMLDLMTIRVGDTVAVTGAGPIGLLCAAIAKGCGASRVWICDRHDARVAMGKKMGAEVAVKGVPAMMQAVMDETRGRGVDVVLEAAGDRETVNAAMALARPGGIVVQIGIPSELDMPIDLHMAMAKELKIQTLKRSNHCSAKAIKLMQAAFIPDGVITHTMPLEKTPEAFDMLTNYRDGAGKIVIEIA